jgi:hypothetical protein
METRSTRKELRSFGVLVGGICAGIGVWPVVIHFAEPLWWALLLAAFLIIPAVVHPSILFWPHKAWMALGHIFGWINTRIILAIVFFAIVTPIGIFRRWLRKDPMGQQLRPELDSYRIVRKPRPASHLTRQY